MYSNYLAFISYRRFHGSRIARWLRNRVKQYTLPQEVLSSLSEANREIHKSRPKVFLDTVYEKAGEDFWQHHIVPSLKNSYYLIVISTPDVFQRRSDGSENWVVREINTFLETASPDRVIVALGPDAPEDRFPGQLGRISDRWDWADLRQFSWRRWVSFKRWEDLDNAFTKIIARLYDIPTEHLPVLHREEARRKTKRLGTVLAVSVVIILALGALTWWALDQRQAAINNEMAAERRGRIATSRQLAANSLQVFRSDLPLALLLAARAASTSDTLEARSALLTCLTYGHYIESFLHVDSQVYCVGFDINGEPIALVRSKEEIGTNKTPRRTVRLWDLRRNQPRGEPFPGCRINSYEDPERDFGLSLAVISSDGRWLAGAQCAWSSIGRTGNDQFQTKVCAAGAVTIWDISSGEAIRRHTFPHAGFVESLAFGPNGKVLRWGSCTRRNETIGSTCIQKRVYLRDVETGVNLEPDGSAGLWGTAIHNFAFNPDGRVIASGKSPVVLSNVETGAKIYELTDQHVGDVTNAAFSPDGVLLVTGGQDGSIVTWKLSRTSVKAQGVPLTGHAAPVTSLAFRNDSKKLLSSSTDENGESRVILWDFGESNELYEPVETHHGDVISLALRSDRQQFATGGKDGAIRVWNLDTRQKVTELDGFSGPIDELAFSPDGRLLVSEGDDRLWDTTDWRQLDERLPIRPSRLTFVSSTSVLVLLRGSLVPRGNGQSYQTSLWFWDYAKYQSIGSPHKEFTGSAQGLAVTPREVVLVDGNRAISHWDVQSRKRRFGPVKISDSTIWAVAPRPQGDTLAFSVGNYGWPGSIHLWDLVKHRTLAIEFKAHTRHARALAFHPTGSILASGSATAPSSCGT